MKSVMITYAEQSATRELFRVFKSEVKAGIIKDTDSVDLNLMIVSEFAQYFEKEQTPKELDFEKIREEMKRKLPVIKTQPYRIDLDKSDKLVSYALEQFVKKLYELDYNQLVELETFLVNITTKINMKMDTLRQIYNKHINDLEVSELEGDSQTIINTRKFFLTKEFEQLKVIEAYRDAYINMQIETVVRKGQFNEHPINRPITQI